MLQLNRHHDFQLFLSPKNGELALTNPPSFNWPQPHSSDKYLLEITHLDSQKTWQHPHISSPFQPNHLLELGNYRWRLTNAEGDASDWMTFSIEADTPHYLPPTAHELFKYCQDKSQFLMYFDEDIETVRKESTESYLTFKETAKLAVDPIQIKYPDHYRRGHEAGKRTAITNVREWIDRDLITLTLLYKIWGEEESGQHAIELLLALAQWSPEGPASVLRPCTWGDEVGLSLTRNLFLAYHWLSPLLKDSEKNFIRPMLIRIAYQMEDRLHTDEFHQYPGHSHTSRLSGYLGIAALALHKEFDINVCERWLNYAIMVYRGIFPFYGGKDGSWAEGAFYSSSYSKWHHPFFLAVERLSDFSFYEHPFYKNYTKFAMDFVGFWCTREGKEWPGFFAQNPLRIYAERFGDAAACQKSIELESQIKCYSLHLLDVIPTVKQLVYRYRAQALLQKQKVEKRADTGRYYAYAGFGIATRDGLSLSYRASQFANSSHRHADQGNIALMDNGVGILTPTGSYGYCFGSSHHKDWTRTTLAHNLPLIGSVGQILDNECATAQLIDQHQGASWYFAQLDLSAAYANVDLFTRALFLIANQGLVIVDNIRLSSSESLQWRLHSQVESQIQGNQICLKTNNDHCEHAQYEVSLISHPNVTMHLSFGYEDKIPFSGGIESDATDKVSHFSWELPAKKNQTVVASCMTKTSDIHWSLDKGLKIELDAEVLHFIDNKFRSSSK